jgi:hypothetical protein
MPRAAGFATVKCAMLRGAGVFEPDDAPEPAAADGEHVALTHL